MKLGSKKPLIIRLNGETTCKYFKTKTGTNKKAEGAAGGLLV